MSSVNCSEFAAGPSPGLYTYTFKLNQLGNTWFFVEISYQSTSQQLLSVQYAELDRNSVYDAWLDTPDSAFEAGHPIQLHLTSNTSFDTLYNSGVGWTGTLVPPDMTRSSYGLMERDMEVNGTYTWKLSVTLNQVRWQTISRPANMLQVLCHALSTQ